MQPCILLPLRPTSPNEAKLQVAQQQARALEAPVLLLHVLRPGAVRPDAVLPDEATARAFLDGSVAQLHAERVPAQCLVRSGAPATTIVDEARTRQARLIIIGNTLRSGLPRALLGSVADDVIRSAPCPVLIVRAAAPPDHSRALLSLAPPDLLVPRDLGERLVDVARIVGSATRAHELGPDFRPPRPTAQDEQRFQSVLAGMARGDQIPPVELYKLGFGYYVRDGHHRVAAARRLGRPDLSAKVIELTPFDDDEAERAYLARSAFERATGLRRVGASLAGSYAQLETMLEAYRRERGLADVREAALRWYDEEFRPLWRRVRALGLAEVPGERPADVIARAGAWRLAEAARTGTLPGWDDAFRRFRTERQERAHPGGR